MRLSIIPALFILFIPLASTGQSTFIKVLGRNNQDLFSSVDETIDGGILFSGDFMGNYSLTRCNSFADTLWNMNVPYLGGVTFNKMCTLNDGRIAFSGTKYDPDYDEAAIMITDSLGVIDSYRLFGESSSWGVFGTYVYAMPDSGVMLAAYEDGYTCSNVVLFFNLGNNLNSIWTEGIGVCDASMVYPHSFNPVTKCMTMLKLRYMDLDSLGNWHHDIPQVVTLDINGSILLNTEYFIDRHFTGISSVSDSGAVLFGYADTLGSKQIQLTRIDKSGTILWEKSFGTIYDDIPVEVIETNDHGFAILASQFLPATQSGLDLVFYKTDSSGQLLFSNTYGSTGTEGAVAMKKKKDGSLLILGRTNGFGPKVNMVIQLDSTGHMNPEYSINSSSGRYCVGDTAILTVTPDASQYAWSTGETTSSIKVTTTGDYELTVTDSTGQEHLVPFRSIYFDLMPDATIINSSPVPICEGLFVPLTTGSWTGNINQWFLNGTLIDTAYHRIFNAYNPGIYQAVVTNACGTDTSGTVEVIQHPNPLQPQVTAFPSNHECSPTPVLLTTNSTADTLHWRWSGGHDVIADSMLLTLPSNYYFNVQAIDSFGCVSPVLSNVHVIIDDQPQVTFANSTANICVPGNTNLPYTTSVNYGTFTLLRNDTVLSTSNYPAALSANQSAVYSIKMTNGCGSDTAAIDVIASPKPDIQIYPATREICSGSPLVLTCTTQGTYRWHPSWNPSGIIVTTRSYLITTPEYYRLEVTDPVTGCQSSSFINVVGSSDPGPVLNLGSDTVLCPGNAITLSTGNFVSYLWSNGSNDSSMHLSNNGSTDSLIVMLTVTDTSNCSATDTVNVVFEICASVNENSKNLLSVYPNPSASEMTFELQSSSYYENARLCLYSLDGRLVREIEFNGNVLRINSGEFSSENYFYVIRAGNESMRGMIGFVR